MNSKEQAATCDAPPAPRWPGHRGVPLVAISRKLVGMANDFDFPSCPIAYQALAVVARTIGETIELRQVFARVAEAAHTVLPFERMRVVLTEAGGLRMY